MDTAVDVLVVLYLVVVVGAVAMWVIMRWAHGEHVRPSLAYERAEALLRDMLTDAEYRQVGTYGYLDVRSPSHPARTYRVPHGPGRVAVHEGDLEVEQLCIAPVVWLPPGDIVLAHKLMIEGNEQEYLRRANHIRRLVPVRVSSGRTGD
jgi:hypothetical protein